MILIPLEKKLDVKIENWDASNFASFLRIDKKRFKDFFMAKAENAGATDSLRYTAMNAIFFSDPKTKKRMYAGKPTKHDDDLKKIAERWSIAHEVINYKFDVFENGVSTAMLVALNVCHMIGSLYGIKNFFTFTLNRMFELDYSFRKCSKRLITQDEWETLWTSTIGSFINMDELERIFVKKGKGQVAIDLLMTVLILALFRAEWEAMYQNKGVVVFMDFHKLMSVRQEDTPRSLLLDYTQELTGKSLQELLLAFSDNYETRKKTIRDAKQDDNNGKVRKFMSTDKYANFLSGVNDIDIYIKLTQAYFAAQYLNYYHQHKNKIPGYYEIYKGYTGLVQHIKEKADFSQSVKNIPESSRIFI